MIIGIGGISRSGKSLLAKRITQWVPQYSIKIFDQDDYVFPVDKIPEIDGETDWECPDSIDFDRYFNAVVSAAAVYNWVIAEGLLAFYDRRLVDRMDKKIFITIPYEVFVERKRPDKRWGIFPEWYIDHIWESHLKYGQPPENDENLLIINGDKPFPEKQIRDYLLRQSF
ncbi:MAG: hypothetical protein GXO83_11215 [Chlorobi bacterium]|nr:hypothetical protein [Chlorobiota bacterium]